MVRLELTESNFSIGGIGAEVFRCRMGILLVGEGGGLWRGGVAVASRGGAHFL